MASRRGPGEGSITRRADGRWMARVDLGWQGGKRCRKTLYGRTKREVQEKLREMLCRTDQGLPVVPEQETVGAFLHRWLEFKKTELRPRSYESYEHLVRAHLLPGLERIRLAKLTPFDVSAWFRRHHAEGAGARTIQYARSVLRAALNKALRWELVARNAAALSDAPRHEAREIRPLSPQQAKTLLVSVAGHRLEALITVAVGLGLRRGEALGLRWRDVDLKAGTLSVRHTLERSGGDAAARRTLLAERTKLRARLSGTADETARQRIATELDDVKRRLETVGTSLRLAKPKTARSRRTITLPGVVAASLRAHRKRQLEERLTAGERWNDSGFVFTTPIGTPIGTHSLHRTFKAMLAKGRPSRHPVSRSSSHGGDPPAGPGR